MVTWLDVESQIAIEKFWDQLEPSQRKFPLPIAQLVETALPVTLIPQQGLDLVQVEKWFNKRNTPIKIGQKNRFLHGCLVAYRNRGFIFFDSDDLESEQRFTIAHEIGHFILDYLNPRAKALAVFGDAILDVLQDKRLPTSSEMLSATIQGVPITVSIQLMERNEQFEFAVESIRGIEERVDRLALALLAPPDKVMANINLTEGKFADRHKKLSVVLQYQYGLPPLIAKQYSYALLNKSGNGSSWVDNLSFT